MTDAGLTATPPKNDGGDYPARPPTEAVKGLFVHYGGRRFFFGQTTETGRSLRRFFRVPEDQTLYRRTGGEGEPVVILDDKTDYDLANGQHYFSEPIPVPAPHPLLGSPERPLLAPTMDELKAKATIQIALDGEDRLVPPGPMRGDALRQALQVPDDHDLYFVTGRPAGDLKVQPAFTEYEPINGAAYRTVLRGTPDAAMPPHRTGGQSKEDIAGLRVPAPAAIPEAGGKPYPYMKEPGAETIIGEDGRVESEDAPIPDFGVKVDASVLGEIQHRLTGIESAVKQVRTVANLAQDEAKRARECAETGFGAIPPLADTVDGLEATLARIEAQNREALEGRSAIYDEAKRARTLAEETGSLGRTNSRQTTDLLEKVVALKAIAAKTDTRLWNQAQALTDILAALGGPEALTERLGRIEKIAADTKTQSLANAQAIARMAAQVSNMKSTVENLDSETADDPSLVTVLCDGKAHQVGADASGTWVDDLRQLFGIGNRRLWFLTTEGALASVGNGRIRLIDRQRFYTTES